MAVLAVVLCAVAADLSQPAVIGIEAYPSIGSPGNVHVRWWTNEGAMYDTRYRRFVPRLPDGVVWHLEWSAGEYPLWDRSQLCEDNPSATNTRLLPGVPGQTYWVRVWGELPDGTTVQWADWYVPGYQSTGPVASVRLEGRHRVLARLIRVDADSVECEVTLTKVATK